MSFTDHDDEDSVKNINEKVPDRPTRARATSPLQICSDDATRRSVPFLAFFLYQAVSRSPKWRRCLTLEPHLNSLSTSPSSSETLVGRGVRRQLASMEKTWENPMLPFFARETAPTKTFEGVIVPPGSKPVSRALCREHRYHSVTGVSRRGRCGLR